MSHSFAQLDLAPTELVVVQPTTLCNLDCDYCFLPLRKENNKLNHSGLRDIFRNLEADRLLGSRTTVCWHLGEPTVLPVQYYETAQRIIRAAAPNVTFAFTMQTNGWKLDEAWCDFFARESMTIGISIDGEQSVNSRRKDWQGSPSASRVTESLRLLNSSGLNYYVIAVLSEPALASASHFYQFFKDAGVRQLCLNMVESEGKGVPQILKDDRIFDLIENFYRELWEIVAIDEDPIWIREIDHSQQAIVAGIQGSVSSQEMIAGSILTILWNGDVLPFTPGFATLKQSDVSRFVVGNLIDGPLSLRRNHLTCLTVDQAVAKLRLACKESCEFFSVCGGGSPAHRWAEDGNFEKHATRTCMAGVQARLRGIVSGLRKRMMA